MIRPCTFCDHLVFGKEILQKKFREKNLLMRYLKIEQNFHFMYYVCKYLLRTYSHHTELIGVLLHFFYIPKVSKIDNLWSHLKVFTGIK